MVKIYLHESVRKCLSYKDLYIVKLTYEERQILQEEGILCSPLDKILQMTLDSLKSEKPKEET